MWCSPSLPRIVLHLSLPSLSIYLALSQFHSPSTHTHTHTHLNPIMAATVGDIMESSAPADAGGKKVGAKVRVRQFTIEEGTPEGGRVEKPPSSHAFANM